MKERDIRNPVAHARYLELVAEDVERLFPDNDEFSPSACPGCCGNSHEPAFVKGRFHYVLCGSCGTLFVTPRPSRDALDRFYMSSESSRYWVESFFKPVAEARRERIFRPRAEFVASALAEAPHGTVADIGAGFGLFLSELRLLWPESRLVAIEPSAEMAGLCRGLGIETVETTIEALAGWDETVDVVTAFELLEHLHEPTTLVTKAYQLLRPGGHAVLTTLNGEGFDIQVLWQQSKSVFPPHHLNFLNPSSMARLCERAGFEVMSVSTPGRIDWDIVENAWAHDAGSVDRFWATVATRGSKVAKDEFQCWLAQHRFSSHMQVVARKR